MLDRMVRHLPPGAVTGARLAPLNVALMDFLDRECDAGSGVLTAAEDVCAPG